MIPATRSDFGRTTNGLLSAGRGVWSDMRDSTTLFSCLQGLKFDEPLQNKHRRRRVLDDRLAALGLSTPANIYFG